MMGAKRNKIFMAQYFSLLQLQFSVMVKKKILKGVKMNIPAGDG
jgi:hypothetical protein